MHLRNRSPYLNFFLFIADDLNKTIQFYHPNPTDPTTTTTTTTTTTDPTTDPPTNPNDLFSDIPLTNSQPPWNPQDHSSPPSDFFEPSLKNHPLPTNAWWQNLGNFLSSASIARIKVAIRVAVIDKTGKIMVLPRFYRKVGSIGGTDVLPD